MQIAVPTLVGWNIMDIVQYINDSIDVKVVLIGEIFLLSTCSIHLCAWMRYFKGFDRCPCKEVLHENAGIYWTDSCTAN